MCKAKCPLCQSEMTDYYLYKHFRTKCQFKNTISMYEFACLINGKDFVDNLVQRYKDGVSMYEIERSSTRKTLSNIPSSAWGQIFTELNIPIRGLKESANSSVCRNKCRTTCENIYGEGITNVSQAQEVKKKKAETFTEHYGVDNIWKTKEFTEWMNDFMMKKYGKLRMSGWDYANDDEREEMNKKRFKTKVANGFYDSMLEERVERILKENSIRYQRCFWLFHHPYDFIVGDHILLEINGDYWHANPKLYKASDILREGVTAQDIWNRDKKFRDCIEGSKFSIIYLWEYDMKKMTDEEILEWV